ncbi:ABC transporter G family member 36 [Senna tora]|uniref:Malic enzyme n=1 Tax=Senna tora TaxID=362788 RepID=A0A834XFL1_9FABA|nr:ABC transporter G family member 36 [Senna tora]
MDGNMSRSSRGSWRVEEVFSSGRFSHRNSNAEDDEEALKWAAIEKLPTYDRLRTSIFQNFAEQGQPGATKEVDVTKLDINERQQIIDRIFKVAEEDNEKFLRKFRDRINKVGITLPTVEVRFQNLTIEADAYIGSRALPTLPNVAMNLIESALGLCGFSTAKKKKLTILKDISGIIKPSRMTLLLGPPSSGKTTLLLALAGKLDHELRVKGEITYNGYKLDEFVPRKTSAYISQNDVHIGEMTVKETFDFSSRCQGVGSRYDLLSELARRERAAGIFPEAELDLFMKAAAVPGTNSSLFTDYTLKILGLDICKDTIVGDEMNRGVSGGQKKRVTTGEMIVGPTNTLFMDEISTGLDSSTTYQIVKCFQQIVHLTEATIFMSLLQPAPETFELFDDIVLISDGQIVYQGPREYILEFFESCGFKCPERKGVADFLQEVTSMKDQEQYWADRSTPYEYITVSEFADRFKQFHLGFQLADDLSNTFNKSSGHRAALVFEKYGVPTMYLLKTCWDKEWLLIKRNSFIYVFKAIQIMIIAAIASTVFLRTEMHQRNENDGAIYIGAMMFSMIMNMFNGFAELALTIHRLPVFYKHRDLLFHPVWTYTLPNFLLRVPISLLESIVWVVISYYTIGFAPEASRFFKQLLMVFLIQQMAAGLFRVIAGTCRSMIISNTGGSLVLLLVMLLGGFIVPKNDIPVWWKWGYWVSPLTYAFNGLVVNEMFAPRWMDKKSSDGSTTLGLSVLHNFNVFPETRWYWIAAAALVGFIVLYNVIFTLALMYLNPVGKKQAIIFEEEASEMESERNKKQSTLQQTSNRSNSNHQGSTESVGELATGVAPKKGMVLPFSPLAMSFDSVNYYVDMPAEMKAQGVTEDRLQLLKDVTGAFRPGVLTALMGVSGAGKTTLMDVLAGRKTGGYIEGDIRISGFLKKQETFARISGYCEQTDIHSPQVTIRESLVFSAFLRLPKEVSSEEKMKFVDEVMELVELDNLKDAIVGIPGITGLSTEQRKRLTIAVELVANPSIIFMDEPTSGLDARAAAIVMRTVRNTVDTGRTVVCTIHQPSIDIFEAFDELFLMKRGGQVIYSGPLGRNSHKIIEFFEAIEGVPKIKDKYNPATWMLEVSSIAAEVRLGIDFAEHYKSSSLYQRNKALVSELSTPPSGKNDLYFPTQFSQSIWGQFKYCLWKQWWTYWRSPDYNLVRYFFTLTAALLMGTIFWKVGNKRGNATQLNMVIGAMFTSVLFVGINNCSTVQPIVAIERAVFYREKAAGMYSALPYAIAQVVSEIPYVFFQTTYYSLIVYAMVSFQWEAAKFFWFFFVSFFSFLYFTYYGMMTVSFTPNLQVASIFAGAFYGLFNIFSGFFIPRPRIPKWWVWYYWICPVAWTVYGLIVSQYGDVEDRIEVPGMDQGPMIKEYIESYYGFDTNFMGPVAAVLVTFTVFFAFMFAFCIKVLNFQTRGGDRNSSLVMEATGNVDSNPTVAGGVRDVYGEDKATEDQLVTPWIVSVASGYSLLRDPQLNKGLAFNEKERDAHFLRGLLPPAPLSQETQVKKWLQLIRQYQVPLQKYMAMINLQVTNERLFYKLLMEHVEELLPVVYTPTVGEACQNYGTIFVRPQGLFISLKDKGRILEVLRNWSEKNVQVIVVTDGERILGLGDLSCQGMGIPVGKLSLYSALGGVRPSVCLPITLDVGTNNERLLKEELYIGLRQRRVTGQEYAEFVNEFMSAVKQHFGEKILVQFEDFANHNAFDLLEKYRSTHLVFNDDIQGTAAVVLAGLVAALKYAGTGIAELLALETSKQGLVESSRKESLQQFKKPWAHDHEPIKELLEAVRKIKPTVLIGTSGKGKTFTKDVVEAMSSFNEGRAIFASGSPFSPVEYEGKVFVPGQANNAYIFPGFGLGLIMSGTIRVQDELLLAASEALASQVTQENFEKGLIYPPFTNIRNISAHIAANVASKAYELESELVDGGSTGSTGDWRIGMTRRCSHCSTNGHNSRTCPSRCGGVKLFGVRLTDGSIFKKSASMGNLHAYCHSSSSNAASPNPGSPWFDPVREHEGYLSDDPAHASSSANRRGGRKRGNSAVLFLFTVFVLIGFTSIVGTWHYYLRLLRALLPNMEPTNWLALKSDAVEQFFQGTSCVPWTEEEHRLFLIGLKELGRGDWRGIARNFVVSRTPTQVASHAQKYFIRKSSAAQKKRRSSLFDMVPDMGSVPPSVSGEQVLPPPFENSESGGAKSQPESTKSRPSLNLSLMSEVEPIETTTQEIVEECSNASMARSSGLTPLDFGFFHIHPYVPAPFSLWPSGSFKEFIGAETSHHQILKPIPIIPQQPVNVDELVNMSHLYLGERQVLDREPLPLSLKWLGEPSRQSAFHANAPVGGSV